MGLCRCSALMQAILLYMAKNTVLSIIRWTVEEIYIKKIETSSPFFLVLYMHTRITLPCQILESFASPVRGLCVS